MALPGDKVIVLGAAKQVELFFIPTFRCDVPGKWQLAVNGGRQLWLLPSWSAPESGLYPVTAPYLAKSLAIVPLQVRLTLTGTF